MNRNKRKTGQSIKLTQVTAAQLAEHQARAASMVPVAYPVVAGPEGYAEIEVQWKFPETVQPGDTVVDPRVPVLSCADDPTNDCTVSGQWHAHFGGSR